MDRVRGRDVEFWTGNVAGRREIDLPKGVFDKPVLGRFFGYFGPFSLFRDGRDACPVALGAVIDGSELGVLFYTHESLKTNKRSIAERDCTAANKEQFALFLLLA